uniref:C-type lectin domain-containing protein n=1 Tax=Poecilia latipinna TaxID=48699 RepID=A0A3B3UAV5_9TELE
MGEEVRTQVFLHSFPSFRPAGWMRFKDKCFMFKGKKDDIKANWSHARSWCRGQGGELAIIDNQYENDLELPTWIGLSDLLVENQYAWSDGASPVLYTNWNEHEPNNAGGTENCVEMYLDGRWNDNNCLQKRGFACRHRQCKELLATFPWILIQSFLGLDLTVCV